MIKRQNVQRYIKLILKFIFNFPTTTILNTQLMIKAEPYYRERKSLIRTMKLVMSTKLLFRREASIYRI